MQDIVILPTYDRPEMLWLCLDHLAASPDHATVQVKVYVDAHIGQPVPSRADIAEVVEKFPQLSIQVAYRHAHQFHGNSYNVLMAYKDAYDTEAKYVYLVEDDVMVHPLFFGWHRAQQEQQALGCSIAVIKEAFHGPYASWGVCFDRKILRHVLPHCRPAYFQNMVLYCKQQFPRATWHCEQDGLLCRILVRFPIVWATTPLAQHVGWYGYHRPKGIRPQGSLEDRYQQVKRALASHEALHAVVRDNFKDVRPLQLDPCN